MLESIQHAMEEEDVNHIYDELRATHAFAVSPRRLSYALSYSCTSIGVVIDGESYS